ncbi:MAG: hypothetical protein FWG84_01195 [Bacteroidales bacterium]|nr:hypothetical protein [Bacteroidales bacterium]
MNEIHYTEKNMIESYSAVLNSLSVLSKIELMERLLKSLRNEQEKIALTANDEFIPEKSAEQIIAELRESRNFGKTRIIEPF